jgi:hypothetical protein
MAIVGCCLQLVVKRLPFLFLWTGASDTPEAPVAVDVAASAAAGVRGHFLKSISK